MTAHDQRLETEMSENSDPDADHLLHDHLLRQQAKAMLIAGDLSTSRLCQRVVSPLVSQLDHAASVSDGLSYLRDNPSHLVLVDLTSGHGRQSRLELRRYLASHHPDTSVVVLADEAHLPLALEAMRAGAFDVLNKPLDPVALAHCVRRACSHALIEQRLHRVAERAPQVSREGIVGDSDSVLRMLDQIGRVANTDVTVLVTGESGTGKELVARSLHHNSARANGPFVPVNCAAIPSELLEAELFGHAKGAFTDAKQAKEGLFVRAQGGTLFLDEIGEMPADMQVKLLRALQERRVRSVGGDAEIAVDIRVVAATNRDLEGEVARGNFREDLYYRLNVVRLETPPLRARGDDVLLLANHFVARWSERLGKHITGFSSEALQVLREHHWPGNVRQLENIMQRAVALARYDQILPEDFDLQPATVSEPHVAARPVPLVPQAAIVEATAAHVQHVAKPPAVAAAPSTLAFHPAPAPPAVLPAVPSVPAGPSSLEHHLEQWTRLCVDGARGKPDDLPTIDALETLYIDVVVKACAGNKTRAAEVLGIARRTLYRRLQRTEPNGASAPGQRPTPKPNVSDDVI